MDDKPSTATPGNPNEPVAKVPGKRRSRLPLSALAAVLGSGIPASAQIGRNGTGWADRPPPSYSPEAHQAAIERAAAKRARRAARNAALAQPAVTVVAAPEAGLVEFLESKGVTVRVAEGAATTEAAVPEPLTKAFVTTEPMTVGDLNSQILALGTPSRDAKDGSP